MLDYKAALSLPQAITSLLGKFDILISEIRGLRSAEPSPRPLDRVNLMMLSNLGNTQGRVPSVEMHIVGLVIGGDTSGRGILTIGTYQIPIWVTLNSSNFMFLREDIQLVVKNDRITWTPPGGTNWDVVIFYHARASDRADQAVKSQAAR